MLFKYSCVYISAGERNVISSFLYAGVKFTALLTRALRKSLQKSFINLGNAGKMSSLGNEILISFRLYLSVYTSSNGGVGWD